MSNTLLNWNGIANLLDSEVVHGEAGIVHGQVYSTPQLKGTLNLNTSGNTQTNASLTFT